MLKSNLPALSPDNCCLFKLNNETLDHMYAISQASGWYTPLHNHNNIVINHYSILAAHPFKWQSNYLWLNLIRSYMVELEQKPTLNNLDLEK